MKTVAIKVKTPDEIRTLRNEEGELINDISVKEREALFRVINETERYSITPTTFDTRTYERDFDNWFFTEQYECGTARALRFGLNYQSKDFMSSVASEIKVFDAS